MALKWQPEYGTFFNTAFSRGSQLMESQFEEKRKTEKERKDAFLKSWDESKDKGVIDYETWIDGRQKILKGEQPPTSIPKWDIDEQGNKIPVIKQKGYQYKPELDVSTPSFRGGINPVTGQVEGETFRKPTGAEVKWKLDDQGNRVPYQEEGAFLPNMVQEREPIKATQAIKPTYFYKNTEKGIEFYDRTGRRVSELPEGAVPKYLSPTIEEKATIAGAGRTDKLEDDLTKLQFRKGVESLEKNSDSVMQSAGAIPNLNKALKLIDKGGVTGKGGQLSAWAAPIMEAFGVSTEGMDDAAMFEGLVGTIRGPLRLAIIGPGPVSEYEQVLLNKMSGGGGAAKEASKELINYYKKQAINKVNKYNKTLEGVSKIDNRILNQFNKITFENESSGGQSGGTGKKQERRIATLEDF